MKKKKRKTSSFNILTSLSWHIIARKPITISEVINWQVLSDIVKNQNKFELYKHSCIYQTVKNMIIIFYNSFRNKSSK